MKRIWKMSYRECTSKYLSLVFTNPMMKKINTNLWGQQPSFIRQQSETFHSLHRVERIRSHTSTATDKPIKFFSFLRRTKTWRNKVYSYLKKGYKSFQDWNHLWKFNLEIDTANASSIRQKSSFQKLLLHLKTFRLTLQTMPMQLYTFRG